MALQIDSPFIQDCDDSASSGTRASGNNIRAELELEKQIVQVDFLYRSHMRTCTEMDLHSDVP